MEQRPKFVDFNGYKFRLSGRYYRKNCWSQPGPSNLHRAIWAKLNGPIPEGLHIHHIDGDSFNNSPENLEPISASEHCRIHTLKLIRSGKLHPPSQIALKRAAEWHKSDEGIKWHRQHGKSTWPKHRWVEVPCQNCGLPFFTPFPSRAKWCSFSCKAFGRDKAKGRIRSGVRFNRRKARLLQGKRATG